MTKSSCKRLFVDHIGSDLYGSKRSHQQRRACCKSTWVDGAFGSIASGQGYLLQFRFCCPQCYGPLTRRATQQKAFQSTFIAEEPKQRKKARLSWYHPDDTVRVPGHCLAALCCAGVPSQNRSPPGLGLANAARVTISPCAYNSFRLAFLGGMARRSKLSPVACPA